MPGAGQAQAELATFESQLRLNPGPRGDRLPGLTAPDGKPPITFQEGSFALRTRHLLPQGRAGRSGWREEASPHSGGEASPLA